MTEKIANNQELIELQRREGCECEPYVDIKSYNKWLEVGFKVKKGEKAMRLNAVVVKKEQHENGKEDEKRYFKSLKACVFCRCQVDALKEAE